MNKKNVFYGLAAMSAIPFCFQLTCEIIQGETTGSMSDPIFWSNTQPGSDILSFSINHGDSGRIVNVGKRVSSISKKVRRK